jgi:hypothetical protein
MPLWHMYQTRKHDFMTYTYKYNYKTGLSAKMCNRIFDYKTEGFLHISLISTCIHIYNQVDKSENIQYIQFWL